MRRNLRGPALKNIHRVRRGDKIHKYHRKTRAKLPDLPENHPDFIRAWMREEEGGTPRIKSTPGTLAAKCEEYLSSFDYQQMSRTYAAQLRSHIDAIRQQYGTAPASQIRDHHIEADLDKLKPHPANHRLKAWRKVALKAAKTVTKRKTPKSDGYPMWTMDQFKAYRDRWPIGSIERAAGELLYWTGARSNDAVGLSRAHVGADGLLTYRQSKTGSEAHVPWTSGLPAFAQGWERDRALLHEALAHCRGFTFLETASGNARSIKGLGNLIVNAARKAGVPRSAHGLRKTRLTLIAEANGSTAAIMAWGGHLSIDEAEHYTRLAQRKKVLLVNEGESVYKSNA